MNIRTMCVYVAVALGAGTVTACDEGGSSPYDELVPDLVDESGRVSFRGVIENAQVENGFRVNGFRVNGFRVNGFRVNGFRVNGFRVNGQDVGVPAMNGNKLQTPAGKKGVELEDLRIEFDYEDPITQQVSTYEQSLTQIEETADGLVLAAVKYRPLPNGTFVNACENGAKSVQVKGDWSTATGARIASDPELVTWACLGAAIGDCAVWGYEPGKVVSGQALDDHHQSCIRLKRADYCGNGTHHTENGHPLDIFDSLGIMTPEQGLNWGIEGFWGPNGAICLNHTRKTNYTKDPNDNSKTYIGCNIPACVDVNNDGFINFADYPTARFANKSVPAAPAN